MKGISIVVCCYNSEHRITPTLEHIFAQQADAIPIEVILINNNCTDQTVSLAQNLYKRSTTSVDFAIFDEPMPGLSYAREAGVEHSKFDLIIFCDDDNWLAPDFVRHAFAIMEADQKIGILGGQGLPVSDIELPFWFSSYQASYAVGVQSLHTGDVSHRGYVWGAGMVMRRAIYLQLKKSGFKHLLTDRKGVSLSSGGDSEIAKWHLLAGYKLWYDERLIYQHYIPSDRLTKEYCEKLLEGFALCHSVLNSYDYILNKGKNAVSKNIVMYFVNLFKYFISLLTGNLQSRKFALTNLEVYNLAPIFIFDPPVHQVKQAIKKYHHDTLNI